MLHIVRGDACTFILNNNLDDLFLLVMNELYSNGIILEYPIQLVRSPFQ